MCIDFVTLHTFPSIDQLSIDKSIKTRDRYLSLKVKLSRGIKILEEKSENK